MNAEIGGYTLARAALKVFTARNFSYFDIKSEEPLKNSKTCRITSLGLDL
jgi:hypothetical protein